MPLTKKDEKKLEELGYKFSHHEKNHDVYKHTIIATSTVSPLVLRLITLNNSYSRSRRL
jgi:predicted RNA binding protein YcfA (HicA-like mRNA interferase family)